MLINVKMCEQRKNKRTLSVFVLGELTVAARLARQTSDDKEVSASENCNKMLLISAKYFLSKQELLHHFIGKLSNLI